MMIGTPKELGAINGVLVKRDMPNEPFINYITVDSIGKICKIIKKNGGTIIIPKKVMGEWVLWAIFKDTERNILGLYEASKRINICSI